MALLLMELSQLEIEPLEVITEVPAHEQNNDLKSISNIDGVIDITEALITINTSPVSYYCCCCCCCCTD